MFTVIFTYLWSGENKTTESRTATHTCGSEAEVNDFLANAQESAAEGIGTYDLQAYTIAVYNGTSLERFGHFHWSDEPVFFDAKTGFFI